ncbi:MAG: DUF4169 family protein [Rhodospirillaceae bacterium]|nr:DUF4169 family protein [Rhodospirillaceae bacterium]
MGEIISLHKRRKQVERLREKRQAAENRRKFGRSKPERIRERAEAERQARAFEGHRLEK